jgi:flagellar motor switch protein FliM
LATRDRESCRRLEDKGALAMRADGSILVRKMRQGGVARSPLPDTALIGEAFARHAEDRFRAMVKCGVEAVVDACRVTRLGDAASEIVSPSMIGLLAIEGTETRAFLSVDAALTWHLTDLLLGADAAEAGAAGARAFTAIDMALGRLCLEALLRAFQEGLATALGRPLPQGLVLIDQRHTMAQIRVAPDYVDALKVRLGVNIGEAGRTGRLDVVVPLATLDVIRAAIAEEGAADARERPNDLWRAAMRRAAAAAPVTLDAVIHRETMTLGTVGSMRPGQVIEIAPDAPRTVEIVLGQPGRPPAVVAHALLGAYRGRKVVRLRIAPDPRLGAHVQRALALGELAAPPERARLPAPEAGDAAALFEGGEAGEAGASADRHATPQTG